MDLLGEMRDGFEFLRLDAADEGDALRVLEEVEPFVTETTAHFVGSLQRKLALLFPREPEGLEERRILQLAAGNAADPHFGRGRDERGQRALSGSDAISLKLFGGPYLDVILYCP